MWQVLEIAFLTTNKLIQAYAAKVAVETLVKIAKIISED